MIGPLTRANREERDNYIVTGILNGRACATGCHENRGREDRTSAYTNLKDPDIQNFLRNQVSDLVIAPGKNVVLFDLSLHIKFML